MRGRGPDSIKRNMSGACWLNVTSIAEDRMMPTGSRTRLIGGMRCNLITRRTAAWTLIEIIGILAVLAIVASIMLPMLIKQIDKSVADQEKITLNALANAFQDYVLNTRVVPDERTWYSAVASQMGVGTNDVLYNVRQKAHLQQRVFLIDPTMQMGFSWGTTRLPYSQTNFVISVGSSTTPMQPVNPRIMIVSSLGKTLPSSVTNGVFSPGHPEFFSNLWSWADGTVPPDAAWNGWTGNAGDVVVQRINLASLFVHLFLQKYPNSTNALFSIDAGAPTNVPTLSGIDGYFIQGSVLYLYTNSPLGQDTRQILARSSSFLFDNGVWRGSLSGAVMGSGVMNLGDVVQQFLNATPNVNAQNPGGNAQQKLVVNNMLNYMSNYNVWAVTYNYNNNGLKTYLNTLQSTMMSSLQGLYNGAYFPTNPTACLQ